MQYVSTAAGSSEAGLTRRCNVVDLGLTNYGDCLELQRALLLLRQNSTVCDTLLLTEHNPVITFGRGYRDETPQLPIPVYHVERGGEGTYHGPGQIVAYPVMNLTENGVGVRTLVSKVLNAAVYALSIQGITSEARFEPVGVWAGDRKIASLGIAVKRWVSFHGIAINVNNTLDGFAYIQPCGMNASTITSAKKLLGRDIDISMMKEDFVSDFMREFSFEPHQVKIGELLPGR